MPWTTKTILQTSELLSGKVWMKYVQRTDISLERPKHLLMMVQRKMKFGVFHNCS